MLQGKVVVITGSGQGIGKHAAKTLRKRKPKLSLPISMTIWRERQRRRSAHSTETLAIHVDVRNEDSVKAMVDEVIDSFGQIDVHDEQRRHRAAFCLEYPALAADRRYAAGFLGSGRSHQSLRHVFRHQTCDSAHDESKRPATLSIFTAAAE